MGDKVLAHTMAARLIHTLRVQAKRGNLPIAGKERRSIVQKECESKVNEMSERRQI